MKKNRRRILGTVVLLLGCVLPAQAWAGDRRPPQRNVNHHPHFGNRHHVGSQHHFRPQHHFGHHHHHVWPRHHWAFFGPVWWGTVYPTYPLYSSSVIVQQAPPVYVQQQAPEQQYWYYCENARGYYPHIQQCPGGWLKVVPN